MRKKYIIELEDNESVYKTINKKDPMIQVFELLSPTPYAAPDIEQVKQKAYDKAYADAVYNCSEGCSHVEQVRKEAYEQGRKDVETQFCSYDACKNRQEEYQRGLVDAWEAARKIGSNSMCSLKEMGFDFSRCVVADYNPSWFVVKNYSASEAIEKIRQYEQTQKELEQEQNEEKPICAEDVMRQYLDTFCKRNFCTKCLLHTPDFTCGRGYHFLSKNPVSDEEVRRAYAKVVKE